MMSVNLGAMIDRNIWGKGRTLFFTFYIGKIYKKDG